MKQNVTQSEEVDRHAPGLPSLTSRQTKALQAIVTGASDEEAAQTAGVSRETVNRWKHQSANFQAALNLARFSMWQVFENALRELLPKAVGVLRDCLENGEPKMRLKAAEAVLRHARFNSEERGPTVAQEIKNKWAEDERSRSFLSIGADF